MLDPRAQLAKGPVILGDEEERIVPEATDPARLVRYDAVTAALGRGADLAAGVGHDGRADVIGGATLVWQRRQLGEQTGIVGLIVALLACVAGRVDAGAAVQR